ncbi:hypothetical protein L6164_017845 [Bauhinia variegata]|uniref:Uncharacterized protein n=1 Tax=Bauhinia variegata TaxID=167791 RepID=A0ACB9NAQ4_BAUVA|nr:hypothetical protein L6164_017845 [Bauhinia variegata]
MKTILSWVSEHKLASIGAVWASGIGASLVAHSTTRSPLKPSLRLIHARLQAQALTLAVLSGAVAYHHFHDKYRGGEQKSPAESAATDFDMRLEEELVMAVLSE